MPSKQQKIIQNMFLTYDKDGSGTFSVKEFERILGAIGMDPYYCRQIFKEVDADRNGEVNYDEFVDWLFGSDDAARRMKRLQTDILDKKSQPTVKASPLENLKKRFPLRSEQELETALKKAGGHAGKALRYLSYEPES
eukprot:TRINITY_DN67884_c0_g1_i1.p1 TRINITY_DN67884_c0_g1~~TRINITY_DN67884_c0_g1_i1.p1  ORF type:complete len:138 (-),score=27.87 TRINITY_DN67884_c0_g1_i1:249-662(-)